MRKKQAVLCEFIYTNSALLLTLKREGYRITSMVVVTELHGFTIELTVELKPNQEPQLIQERSLENLDLTNDDYRLSNLNAYPPRLANTDTTTATLTDDLYDTEEKLMYSKVVSIPSI